MIRGHNQLGEAQNTRSLQECELWLDQRQVLVIFHDKERRRSSVPMCAGRLRRRIAGLHGYVGMGAEPNGATEQREGGRVTERFARAQTRTEGLRGDSRELSLGARGRTIPPWHPNAVERSLEPGASKHAWAEMGGEPFGNGERALLQRRGDRG